MARARSPHKAAALRWAFSVLLSGCLVVSEAQSSFFAGIVGENECPGASVSADKESCLDAVLQALPAGATQGRKFLVEGSWGHVPPGCSMQSDGDWAAHFNTNAGGVNNGQYTLICMQVGGDCADAIDGGGWTLVRHTKGSGTWGPWNDQLAGQVQVGEPAGPLVGHDWTVPWNSTGKEFLFVFGDCSSWLITTPFQVVGETYANQPRWIRKSSEKDMPYQARWYNRVGNREDPWVTVLDHHVSGGDRLYGEGSWGNSIDHKNAHAGANVYIRTQVVDNDDCSGEIDGGFWTLVRHTKGYGAWGPWNDNLEGSVRVGEPAGALALEDWTVPWDSTLDSTGKEFLFAFGDCSSWLIATPFQVVGENYANEPRWIRKSSEKDTPHRARWYNRENRHEDPWVTLLDHHSSNIRLYGENSYYASSSVEYKNAHGGANVYIRRKVRVGSPSAGGVLHMPDAGRRVRLGELYDARSDTAITGLLWDPSIIQKHRYLTRAMYTQVDFAKDDSIRSKKTLMGIAADTALHAQMGSTKLNVMCSFRYMTAKRSTERALRMTTSFRTRTLRESLDVFNPEVLSAVNGFVLGDDPCPAGKKDKCKKATHVVTGVVWGADVYALFESLYENETDYKALDQYFNLKLGTPMSQLQHEAAVTAIQEEEAMSRRTRVTIYGDLKMQHELPTRPREALDFMRKIPEHADTLIGDGVPMELILTPLTWLQDDAAQIRQTIKADTIERFIDIYEELDASEAKILDLLGVNYEGFRGWKEDVDAYYKGFESFRSNFSNALSKAMASFQGGLTGMDALTAMENTYLDSEYYSVRVTNEVEKRRDNIMNLLALVSQFGRARITFARHLSQFFAPTFDSRCDRVYALMLVGYRPSSDRAGITKIREFINLAKSRLIKNAKPSHPWIRHCLERTSASEPDKAECVEELCFTAIHFDSYCTDFCPASFCPLNSVGGQMCPTTAEETPPCEMGADEAEALRCTVNNHTGACGQDPKHNISNDARPLSDCWCSCPRTQVLEYYHSQPARRLAGDMPRAPRAPLIYGVAGAGDPEPIPEKQVAFLHVNTSYNDGARNYRVTLLWETPVTEGDTVFFDTEQTSFETPGRLAWIPLRNLIAGREYRVEVQGLNTEGSGPPREHPHPFRAAWRMATVTFQGAGSYVPPRNEGPDWSSEQVSIQLSLPALDTIAHVSLHAVSANPGHVDILQLDTSDPSLVQCEQYDQTTMSESFVTCTLPLNKLPRADANSSSPREYELRVWGATHILAAKSMVNLYRPSAEACARYAGGGYYCPQTDECVSACQSCLTGSIAIAGECLPVSCEAGYIFCPALDTCLVKGSDAAATCSNDCKDSTGSFGRGAEVVVIEGEEVCISRCKVSLPEGYRSARRAKDLVPRGGTFAIGCVHPWFNKSGEELVFTCPPLAEVTTKEDVAFVYEADRLEALLDASLPVCAKCPSDQVYDAQLGSCRYVKSVGTGWNYVTNGDFRNPPQGLGKPGWPFETIPASPSINQMKHVTPGIGGDGYALKLTTTNQVVCLRQRLPMTPLIEPAATISGAPRTGSIWRASVAYKVDTGSSAVLCLRDRNLTGNDCTSLGGASATAWQTAEVQLIVADGADRLEVDVCAAGYGHGSGSLRIDHLAVHAFEGHLEAVPSLADVTTAGASAAQQPVVGVVAYFKTSCPAGWVEESDAAGRVVIGLGDAGSQSAGQQVGASLSPGQARVITEVPKHAHLAGPLTTSIDGEHTHEYKQDQWKRDGGKAGFWAHNNELVDAVTSPAGAHTHTVQQFSTHEAGVDSVDVTMPYVNLVACRFLGTIP